MSRRLLTFLSAALLAIQLLLLAPPAPMLSAATHAPCRSHRCACSTGQVSLANCCCRRDTSAPAAPDQLSSAEQRRWKLAWGGMPACPARPALVATSNQDSLRRSRCDGPDPEPPSQQDSTLTLKLGPLPCRLASLAPPGRGPWPTTTLWAQRHSPDEIETIPIG